VDLLPFQQKMSKFNITDLVGETIIEGLVLSDSIVFDFFLTSLIKVHFEI
jgi:hypothetical protein